MARTQTTTMAMTNFNDKLFMDELERSEMICETLTDAVTDCIDSVKYRGYNDDDLYEMEILARLATLMEQQTIFNDSVSTILALSHKPEGK